MLTIISGIWCVQKTSSENFSWHDDLKKKKTTPLVTKLILTLNHHLTHFRQQIIYVELL